MDEHKILNLVYDFSVEHQDSFLKLYALINAFDCGRKVAEHISNLLPKEIIDNEVIENIKSTQNKDQEVPDDVVGFSDEEVSWFFYQLFA